LAKLHLVKPCAIFGTQCSLCEQKLILVNLWKCTESQWYSCT